MSEPRSPGEGWGAVGRASREEYAHPGLPHTLLRAVTHRGDALWRLQIAPGSASADLLRRAAHMPLPGPLWLDLAQHTALAPDVLRLLGEGPWPAIVTVLHLTQAPVDDTSIPWLASLASLRELCLSNTRVTAPGLSPLAALPELSVLSLRGTAVDGQGLSRLAHLRSLDLSQTAPSADGWGELGAMASLQRLSLAHVSLKGRPLAALSGLVSLRALDLARHLPEAEIDLGSLEALVGLEALALGGAVAAPGAMRVLLGSLPALRTLDLSGSSVSDADLCALLLLDSLDLAGTAITDASAPTLMGCPRLSTLVLSRCAVTDRLVFALMEHPALRSLSLFDCEGISAGSVAQMRAGKRIDVEWFASDSPPDGGSGLS